MSESKRSFADFLRDVMKAHGLSESELSRRSGLAQPTINRILNQTGGGGLRISTIQLLAKGLLMPVEIVADAAFNLNKGNYGFDRFEFYAELFDAPNLEYTEWQFLERCFS